MATAMAMVMGMGMVMATAVQKVVITNLVKTSQATKALLVFLRTFGVILKSDK